MSYCNSSNFPGTFSGGSF